MQGRYDVDNDDSGSESSDDERRYKEYGKDHEFARNIFHIMLSVNCHRASDRAIETAIPTPSFSPTDLNSDYGSNHILHSKRLVAWHARQIRFIDSSIEIDSGRCSMPCDGSIFDGNK